MGVSKGKGQITLFFIISVFYTISISAFDPFIAVYANSLGFRPAMIGIIVGAAGFSSMLARFPTGIMADVLKNKLRVIRFGLMITIIGWTAAFLYPIPATFLIGKIADGLTGAVWVVVTTLFTHFFSKEQATKSIGLISFSATIGNFLGSIIGGTVAHLWGYHYSFLVAIFSAILALLLTFLLKEVSAKTTHKKIELYAIKEQLSDSSIWILGLLTIIALMVPYSTRDLFTPILAIKQGGNALTVTLLANIHMIFGGLAQLMTGTFFERYLGLKRTVAFGAAGQGAGTFLLDWGTDEATGAQSVLLSVPGSTTKYAEKYATTLTWTLTDTPDNA
ncbi:MFS transporter [Enterococcus pingfangensis]|uniref:MFS transporter n=1 Tax=Enterococcus pingfangensis TaxID=2559924 RepID=UPI0010F761D1|nr:MFS transporter [Enterococcus pingfangensis]